VHPIAGVIDGFVFHGGGRGIHTDVRTPAWLLFTETDVTRSTDSRANDRLQQLGFAGDRRQPDHKYLRTWEVAGAAHAGRDLIDPLLTRFAHDIPAKIVPPDCTRPPLSEVPSHFVQEAVYDWMKRWIE